MNYIIWNGVNSTSIPGLLICELPPITKSKIRTQITEIEGKDGDFVDKIGYQSYDKTIKIGLVKILILTKLSNILQAQDNLLYLPSPINTTFARF